MTARKLYGTIIIFVCKNISDLSRRISTSFLFQKISAAVQLFNAVLLHNGFVINFAVSLQFSL